MAKFKYIKREWKNGRWNYTYPEERANDRTENAKYLSKMQKQREDAAKKKAREEKFRDILGYDEKDKLEKAKAELEFREKNLEKSKESSEKIFNKKSDFAATKQHEMALKNYTAAKLAYDKTMASKIEAAKSFVAKQKRIKELKAKTTYPEERATDFTENAEYLKARRKDINDKMMTKAVHAENDRYINLAKRGSAFVDRLFK